MMRPHGGLPVHVDPTLSDGITAWADCLSTVSGCMREAGEAGDVGACVASAPVCATDTPWEEGPCCPADCVSAFDAAVSAGSSAHDAYVQAWVMEPACFPGVSP
jgi:hypothetical protein